MPARRCHWNSPTSIISWVPPLPFPKSLSSSLLGRRVRLLTSSSSSSSSYSSSSLMPESKISDIPTSSPSVLTVLQDSITKGILRRDKAQERVAKRLSRLQKALIDYDNESLFQPPVSTSKETKSEDDDSAQTTTEKAVSSRSSSSSSSEKDDLPAQSSSNTQSNFQIPRGLYIYGSVGTGKTMMMDSFFNHADVNKKSRYHFHAFLSQVHQRVHDLKQKDLAEKGRNFSVDTSEENNPIHRVAMDISQSTSLLCLDEFQVTDIADALILSQLFRVLFLKGTVVVTTSNRPPQDLYEGGLNRSYFLPFLDLLERHCIVHAIQSDTDYRRVLASCSSFFGTNQKIEPLVDQLVTSIMEQNDSDEDVDSNGSDYAHGRLSPTAIRLSVGFRRFIHIDRSYETSVSNSRLSACRLDFLQVCDADVGASDFRAIGQAFDIVSLENVPTMDLIAHNRARRFITFIDELYESKCCLALSTEEDVNTPMDLFRIIPRTNNEKNYDDPETELGVDVATQGGIPVGASASVRELAFAFERASSRIVEMCSRSWWEKRLPNQII